MALRILLLVMLVSMVGCGDGRPTRIPVSGQVVIDGQPLTHGFVQVVPENDRPATGEIGPDGRFSLTTFEPGDGCVPGTHKVAVIANETLDARSQKWHAPKNYMDIENSGLTITVKEPTDSARIELTWDGGEAFIEKFDAE